MLELIPNLPIAGALALVGAIVGAVLVGVAARRTLAQPVALAVQDEVLLLIGVLSDLRRLPYLTSLRAQDFASGANGRLWEGLCTVATAELANLDPDPTDEQCTDAGMSLVARANDVHLSLHALLGAGPTGLVDLERLAYLSQASAGQDFTDDQVVDAGQAVLLTGTDRSKLGGPALVVAGPDPDSIDADRPPLVRVYRAPTRVRRVLTAAATAAGGGLLYGLATSAGLAGVSLWLAVAALAVLLVGSVVIALVDLDTFYVDLRTFVVTALGAWVLALASVGVGGHWARAVSGLVVVAATAVMFEVVNRIYRFLRGVDGQGFGDTLIVIATAGVPPAIVGDWMLGYYSVMGGFVLAVLGWSVSAALGRVTRSSAVAFGPYLAAGWVVGWVAYVVLT